MQSFGWRIPFVVAGPLAAIALYFRYRIKESPAFSAVLKGRAEESQKSDGVSQDMRVIEVLRAQGRPILPVMGIAAAGNVIAYTMTSFTPTYLNQTLGFKGAQGTLIIFPLFVDAAFATQIFASLSDKIGRKPILFIGAGLGILLPVPAFMMASGNIWGVPLGTLFIMVYAAMFSSSYASALPEQFPTESRSSALGLAYNVGNAAFGGTAPLAIAALIGVTGNVLIPAFYLMGAALPGLISVFFLKETSRRPLNGSLPNVETEDEALHLVQTQDTNPLIDREQLPVAFVAYARSPDGAVIQLHPSDIEVQRAASAAGIALGAEGQIL